MLRRDLENAEIDYTDDCGRVLDFHALRHSYISNLAASGIHPKLAQTLAGHSTITLTMDRYTHVDRQETAAAVDRIPVPAMHGLEAGSDDVLLMRPFVGQTDFS